MEPELDCPPPLEFAVKRGGSICVFSSSHREWWKRELGEAAAICEPFGPGMGIGAGEGEELFSSLFRVLGNDVDGKVPFTPAPFVCVRLALAGWDVEALDMHNISASKKVKGGERFISLQEKVRCGGGGSFWRWNVTGKF